MGTSGVKGQILSWDLGLGWTICRMVPPGLLVLI